MKIFLSSLFLLLCLLGCSPVQDDSAPINAGKVMNLAVETNKLDSAPLHIQLGWQYDSFQDALNPDACVEGQVITKGSGKSGLLHITKGAGFNLVLESLLSKQTNNTNSYAFQNRGAVEAAAATAATSYRNTIFFDYSINVSQETLAPLESGQYGINFNNCDPYAVQASTEKSKFGDSFVYSITKGAKASMAVQVNFAKTADQNTFVDAVNVDNEGNLIVSGELNSLTTNEKEQISIDITYQLQGVGLADIDEQLLQPVVLDRSATSLEPEEYDSLVDSVNPAFSCALTNLEPCSALVKNFLSFSQEELAELVSSDRNRANLAVLSYKVENYQTALLWDLIDPRGTQLPAFVELEALMELDEQFKNNILRHNQGLDFIDYDLEPSKINELKTLIAEAKQNVDTLEQLGKDCLKAIPFSTHGLRHPGVVAEEDYPNDSSTACSTMVRSVLVDHDHPDYHLHDLEEQLSSLEL